MIIIFYLHTQLHDNLEIQVSTMSALCNVIPHLYYSALLWSVSFSLYEFLLSSYLCLYSNQVYLGFYTIRIASLQGNHGYFSYEVINKNKKQDRTKLENI